MTLIDIIKKGLIAEGFTGLYQEDECGCGLEDFAPCADGPDCNFCTPGYATEKDGDLWVQGNKPESRPEEEGDDHCAYCSGPCEFSTRYCIG